jgi:hypothetical protein
VVVQPPPTLDLPPRRPKPQSSFRDAVVVQPPPTLDLPPRRPKPQQDAMEELDGHELCLI